MRNSPGIVLLAVLTIGVGIGANTTIFSWVRSLLLNPLPGAADAGRVVAMENTAPNGTPITTSYLDFRDYRDNLKLVQNVTAYRGYMFAVGDAPRTERVWGEVASGNYFELMGIQPEAGRFFSSEERGDTQNAHAVVVISYRYWQQHYGGSPAAVGSTLKINRTPFTVVGIAPKAYHGALAGLSFDVWVPMTMYGQLTHTGTWMLEDRNTRNFMLMGRLAPGTTREQANAELGALARRMSELNADSDRGIGARVLPLAETHFGTQAMLLTPVMILMGAGGVVLLIVCANLANLLLVRATGRVKEFSVRLALGAKPRQIAMQLLVETLVLASVGTALGLIVAVWLGDAMRWLMPAVSIPTLLPAGLDYPVLAFSAGLAVVVAGLAGIAPAIQAARANINGVLKQSGRGTASGGQTNRIRGLLVVGEVALAVVALVAAGLCTKSLQNARSVDPGFKPDGVALVKFDFSTTNYDAREVDNFCRRLQERAERLPGVVNVSYDDSVPLGFYGGNWETVEVEGYVPGPNENMKIYRDMVSPGFFATMKIPLLEGRDFNLRDDRDSQMVTIVNQEFVRRFLNGRNAIGVKVHGWGKWFTIVGVAKDSKYHQVTEAAQPYFYIPIRQEFRPEYGLTFQVRTAGSVGEVLGAMQKEVAAIDPALTIFDAESLSEYIAASLFGAKIAASLLSLLSGVGLLLAAMGLYGVLAFSVAQRTQELGVRMALGATTANVLALVVRQGLLLTLVGLGLGMAAALGVTRFLAGLLYEVKPADPITFAGVAVLLGAVALLACYVPARRATRIDPMEALRYE